MDASVSTYTCTYTIAKALFTVIIEDKAEIVRDTIETAGFEILEVNHLGEWAGIVARKK